MLEMNNIFVHENNVTKTIMTWHNCEFYNSVQEPFFK